MNRRRFLGSSIAAAVSLSLINKQLLAALPTTIAGDIEALTGSGVKTTLGRSALQNLKDSLRGALMLPGESGYDQARRVLNQSIDKHPAVIVQPTGTTDVRTAVAFAREHSLLLAVKCGGHSYSGKSTCEGGMQIDLSRFRGVRVDPTARIATVSGGSLLGEIDHETRAFELVTTTGTVSHTGVGGLTLGAGFGRVARRHGLALDNVRAVDVVTADGQLRHASADENPDLYWGVRGGGGNFGVVTAFEFQLHPMQRQVVGGALVFPISRAREVLNVYRDFSLGAPDAMYSDYVMARPAGGKDGMALIHVCWSGPASEADKALAPLRKLGTPLNDSIRAIDYVAIQRVDDQTDPRNNGTYLKSGFIDAFDAKLAEALVVGFEGHPDRDTVQFFQHSGGAIGRVASDATAFPHRRSTHNMFAAVSWPLPGDGSSHVRYLRDYWNTLEPFTNGYYTNEVGDEGQHVIDENYQGNLPRLQQLKNRYDPTNLFRLNANVKPTV